MKTNAMLMLAELIIEVVFLECSTYALLPSCTGTKLHTVKHPQKFHLLGGIGSKNGVHYLSSAHILDCSRMHFW